MIRMSEGGSTPAPDRAGANSTVDPGAANAVRESDAVAVERTLAGERDAFRVLVERHSQQLFRLAFRMTRSEHDAEEVVQEAFLRAYRNLGQFGARANFGTWVYRIAANYAIDRMRQKRTEEARREGPNNVGHEQEQNPLDLVHDERPTPDRLASSTELRKKMEEALNTLSDSERTAFVMRHWEGCAIEEIAKVLKSTSGAAKNTVFRSIQKLRRALEPYVTARGAMQVKAIGTTPESAAGTEI
jgi:RNA polymerase sigma-70 factor (ECF subfamily)